MRWLVVVLVVETWVFAGALAAVVATQTGAFAQKGGATDAISGGAGWVGAGLLGAVLSWLLLVHLPSKDKQVQGLIDRTDVRLKEFIDAKDKALSEIIDEFRRESKEVRVEFKEALNVVEVHCDRRMTELAKAMSAGFDQLSHMLGGELARPRKP